MTGVLAAWDRFWFAPAPTSTIGLVRIAFGIVMVGWGLALTPDLLTFFSQDGVVPLQPPYVGWGLLRFFPSDAAVIGVFVAHLVASVCLLLGVVTRLAAAVVFVTLLSLLRRDPFIFNSGDAVLLNISFFLALGPAGESLSIDRLLRARGRFWEFPERAQWPVRLMQVQLSVIYFVSVWAKVRGTTWNDGTAVSYALRLHQLHRFPIPRFLTSEPLIVNLLTYGTLAVELGIAILVWNRRARPWVLAAGAFLHLSIDYSLEVGFFTLAMLTLYLAFLPPETAARLLLALRRWLERSGIRTLQRLARA